MNGKRELATLHRANVTGWFTMSKAAVAGWAAPKAFGAAAADPYRSWAIIDEEKVRQPPMAMRWHLEWPALTPRPKASATGLA